MPSELEYQNRIIRSAIKSGGHGRKWGSKFQVGMPDLILSLPDVGAFLMEVKLVKVRPENLDTFDVDLGITDKQSHELTSFHRAGALAVVGAVVAAGPRETRLVIVPHDARRLTGHEAICSPFTSWSPKVGGFNLIAVMKGFISGH